MTVPTLRRYLPVVVATVALSLPICAAQVEAPGVPNFHEVNQQVYRGAQPFNSGWATLSKLGITMVIDLRRNNEDGEHSIADEQKLVEAAGMHFISVPMNGIVAPTEEQISKVLAVLNSGQRVFVHCKMGMDRTGTVIAIYRMTHDQWDNKKAYNEAKSYGLHWYEAGMKRYIREFHPPVQLAGGADVEGGLAHP